jgi:hypothetical protein
MKHLKYVSKPILTNYDCPSVFGRYAELIFIIVPCNLNNLDQKLLTNTVMITYNG